ncbi:GvpL/GvpF family gas vesicle protein [Aliinostoc sp. HNIBRCY26]|uniref:GvpL/GvpF family gas vesicle protein n=1 Tax=Aliinostoc sp. HNIBRCY26 TaxID=3418997 RepID=UPI003CFFCBE5
MMRSQNFYTYAFLKTPDFSLTLPEGNIAPVILMSGANISAIVEPGISPVAYQTDDQQVIKMVLAHDRVIRELFQQTTILPLRFGTHFNSQESLLNHIDDHAEEYLEKLKNIQNKDEYTLKLIPQVLAEPKQLAVGSGRDYFLAKKQYYETQKIFHLEQNEERNQLIDSITETYPSSVIVQQQAEEFRLYFLIDRHEQAALLAKVAVWQKASPHWNLILGEPLPPYHFI